nr:MAG TPA: hypothetical protein [Caudoviricetes sp.]
MTLRLMLEDLQMILYCTQCLHLVIQKASIR